VLWWSRGRLSVRGLETGVTLTGDDRLAATLAAFGRPRTGREALELLRPEDRAAGRQFVSLFLRFGFLLPAAQARRMSSHIRAWKENVASAFHRAASSNLRYATAPAAVERVAQERMRTSRRPPLFKSHRVRTREKLVGGPPSGMVLETALLERRTVREFRRTAVELSDLATVVGGTWGRTGTQVGGLFGSLPVKTSPSAGSIHPIECYVLAWNVRGLEPGLYHYDVRSGELRRLRRGRFRAQAVRAASGQAWVGRAGFLCVMTAVFGRSLWKYDDEVTYRTLFLDAGHLAQTFCLLATARGLGPFTTAAIQDSFIEKFLGLDGTTEFPVYLCGAGVPARGRAETARRKSRKHAGKALR
jgi:SagB-type dehydrogenase family enzyme